MSRERLISNRKFLSVKVSPEKPLRNFEIYLVTLKLPKTPAHDPKNKLTGTCPVSDICTDSTGEHHTTMVWSKRVIERLRAEYHITRVETLTLELAIEEF